MNKPVFATKLYPKRATAVSTSEGFASGVGKTPSLSYWKRASIGVGGGGGLPGGCHARGVGVLHLHRDLTILGSQMREHLQARDPREAGLSIVKSLKVDGRSGLDDEADERLVDVVIQFERFLVDQGEGGWLR